MAYHHMIGRAISLVLAVLLAAGCAAASPEQASLPATAAPPATAARSAAPPATAELPATATLAPVPTPAPTMAPRKPYAGTLDLVPVQQPPDTCLQPSPLGLPSRGVIPLAFIPSGFCVNGEIGLIEIEGRLYIAQAILGEGAFTLIDATDPTAPQRVGAWQWQPAAVTYDLKPFRQGRRHYLALAMENYRRPFLDPCGIAFVEVTDPRAPVLLGRYDGSNVGSDAAWCNVHTVEIDTDTDGDATFLLASARDTFDLRVLDIRDLHSIRQVNTYHLHAHPHGGVSTNFKGSYVHDSTIAGDRVYVSYWNAGVMILDKRRLLAGEPPDSLALNPPNSIAPLDFNVHHSFPTADGNFLFVEAEDHITGGLRLFDIRDPARPREVLTIDLDTPRGAPHNLLVVGDLLLVGWYNDGVQVFRYDVSDPTRPIVAPIASQAVRAKVGDNIYDGIWGVRTHSCQVRGQERLCIYASDLRLGVVILALEATESRQ
jgi:hypothetical protein